MGRASQKPWNMSGRERVHGTSYYSGDPDGSGSNVRAPTWPRATVRKRMDAALRGRDQERGGARCEQGRPRRNRPFRLLLLPLPWPEAGGIYRMLSDTR